MADRRKKDINWWVAEENGETPTWERVQLAVLMDLRDELKIISRRVQVLECRNFLAIPRTLQRISANTAKPRIRKPRIKGRPKLRVVSR